MNSERVRSRAVMSSLLLCVGLMVGQPTTTAATMISVPLTELVGEVEFPTSAGQTVSFDFGLEFIEISGVWLEVEAMVHAQEFDVCGTVFNPRPCTHEVLLLGFFGRLDTEDVPAATSVISEGLSFSEDPYALEGAGIDVGAFDPHLVGWEYLLDGAGSMTLHWNGTLQLPGTIIRNEVPPSGQILSARLIVDGVAVPEPVSAALLGIGLLILGRRRFCTRNEQHQPSYGSSEWLPANSSSN